MPKGIIQSKKISDASAERWLASFVNKHTVRVYESALRSYMTYTGLTPEELIKEAFEDSKKSLEDKRNIVKQRIIGFYKYLTTEAIRRKSVGYDKETGTKITENGKGLADKTASSWVAAIRSFYNEFDIVIKLARKIPKPVVKNRRRIVNAEEVKRLVDAAKTKRDKAIILFGFQAGLDSATICNLKYGDVKKGLESGEHPLKLSLTRMKTRVSYYTFLGADAISSLKVYLTDLKAKGIELSEDDTLFLKGGGKALSKEGIDNHHIFAMYKQIAVLSGLVKTSNGMNPVGSHSMRESFGSILANLNVGKAIINFLLGHASQMEDAYERERYDSVRETYIKAEKYLSISGANQLANGEKLAELEKQLDLERTYSQGHEIEIGKLYDKIAELEKKLAAKQ